MDYSVGSARATFDQVADVLYITLRRCDETIGRQDDSGLVRVHDARTDEIVGVMILDFWARFVKDGVVDEQALAQMLEAPFGDLIPEIRDAVIPA
jgi:hypothetical protein